jgi:hypothetical protein
VSSDLQLCVKVGEALIQNLGGDSLNLVPGSQHVGYGRHVELAEEGKEKRRKEKEKHLGSVIL